MRAPDWQSEDGSVALYHGDCRGLLPELTRQTMAIVTDPPYGMQCDTDFARFSGGSTESKSKRGKGRDYGAMIHGDAQPFDPSPLLAYRRVVIWGFQHFAARLPVGTTLVWIKRNDAAFGTFLSDADLAWMKGGHGVFCMRSFPQAMAHDRHHPTEKPVDLMEWCISRCGVEQDGIICDPYMGSGTTIVAAVRTGRRAIGIEIEKRYFDIAVRRVEAAFQDQALFRQPAASPAPALFGESQ